MNIVKKTLHIIGLSVGFIGAAATAPSAETAPEIELKFQLDSRTFDTFEGHLEEHIKAGSLTYQGSAEHEEWYFNNPSDSFWFLSPRGFLDAYTTLRIRKTAKKSTYCKKVRHVDEKGRTIKRDETEEVITDAEAKIKELRDAGYTDILEFNKTRKKYVCGPFELVVDRITGAVEGKTHRGLGQFIEVEYTEKGVSVEEGMARIKAFLKTDLGLTLITVIDRSYPHMLKNPEWETHSEWGFMWKEDLPTGKIS